MAVPEFLVAVSEILIVPHGGVNITHVSPMLKMFLKSVRTPDSCTRNAIYEVRIYQGGIRVPHGRCRGISHGGGSGDPLGGTGVLHGGIRVSYSYMGEPQCGIGVPNCSIGVAIGGTGFTHGDI